MLTTIAIANYRSLRDLVLPLGRLNVVTGPNGSGKSSLYRALRLLAETSRGGLVRSLAREGGLPSIFWAGPEKISRAMRSGAHRIEGTVRGGPAQLKLGFASEDFGYAVDVGYPVRGGSSAFALDPEIKRECVWAGPVFRPTALLVDRRGPSLRAIDDSGAWAEVPGHVAAFDSMMTAFADPRSAPEMITIRERMRSWRFHDHFRTDRDSPCRRPQIGTHTPVLGDDGSDFPAALQTIREIGDGGALDAAIADAFPGAAIDIAPVEGRFELGMRQRGLLRPLRADELSDGTLRYLILIAALLSPRPPELLVLNEPETSLHPELIPALARLIGDAAARSQVVVVTHDAALVAALRGDHDANAVELEKSFGETASAGDKGPIARRWEWPRR